MRAARQLSALADLPRGREQSRLVGEGQPPLTYRSRSPLALPLCETGAKPPLPRGVLHGHLACGALAH